jgi:glucosamine--fructose-6-phosphate aminotransferase (isomerizing)
MCGIVGYIGDREAQEILIKGLSRLEYRGYDSAGVAVVNGSLEVRKKQGRIARLSADLANASLDGKLGIGHTRWATHGAPNDENAHPHVSTGGSFALVHNGIIENYTALRDMLTTRGYSFVSQTDTEVLVRLIEDFVKQTDLSLGKAVRQALSQVKGTYGIALVTQDDPDMLIAARKGSPLILGVGDGEYFLGSDAAPIVEYTRKVVYLNDGELVIVRRNGFKVFSVDEVKLNKTIHELEWDLEQIEKGGYEHFMLKEIMEQPTALENAMRGRLFEDDPFVKLGGLMDSSHRLRKADRIILCACGTSWHAALVGEYLIEAWARIPVEVEYASEFRYRNPILRDGDAVLVISQSGETADTLAAVREAQRQGIPVYGICNTVGSTIARETDAGVYLHAGPEIGVASTKAFTAQVTILAQLALKLAQDIELSEAELKEIVRELKQIPSKIAEVLEDVSNVEHIAKTFR